MKATTIGLMLCLAAAALAAPVTREGYLADILCVERVIALDAANMITEPEKHSVHCLLIQVCINSGFTILEKYSGSGTPTGYGQMWNFTAAANTRVVTWLRQYPESKKDMLIVATGEEVGGKFDPTSFQLKSDVMAQDSDASSSSVDGSPCTGSGSISGLPSSSSYTLFDDIKFMATWSLSNCDASLRRVYRVVVMQNDVIIREQPGREFFLRKRGLAPGSYVAGAQVELLMANGSTAHTFRAGSDFTVAAPVCTSLSVSLPSTLSVPNDQSSVVVTPTVNTAACPNVPLFIEFTVANPTSGAVLAVFAGSTLEIDAREFSAGEVYRVTANVSAFVGNETVTAVSNALSMTFTEGSGSGAGVPPPCDNFYELDGIPEEVRERGDRPLRVGAALRTGCPLPAAARVRPVWKLYNAAGALASQISRMTFVAAPGDHAAGTYTLMLSVVVTNSGATVTLTRNVTVVISEAAPKLRILGGNRTVASGGVLDFLADGVNVAPTDVQWGLCTPDLTQSGLQCLSAVTLDGITGATGWSVYATAPTQAGSWVLWATAKGVRSAVLVTVTTDPVLEVSIFGVPLRPIAGGAPVTLFAHADDATSYTWHLNGGSALSGRTASDAVLTAAEVTAAANANGGKVAVRATATNAAGTTGEAHGEFTVVQAKQGKCSAAGAKGFGKLTGGDSTMTLGASGFSDTGVEVLYSFGYEVGSRQVLLNDDFTSVSTFNFTAPMLPGRGAGGVTVTFIVEAIPAEAIDDPLAVPVVARCQAQLFRNTKVSNNVTAYAELADAALGIGEEAGDLGQVLQAMAGVTTMFGEFTAPSNGSATAEEKTKAAAMRKSSLGSLARTFTKAGGKMTNTQREQVLTTMSTLFGDDDAEADVVDDVSSLLGGVLGDVETGGLDMAKLGTQVVKMLLKVPDNAQGNTSRRALSQKAALATASNLRVGEERTVMSGTLTLRATKLPVDAMAKKNVTAGTKVVNVPRAAFGSANLSKSTEVGVSTVDYGTVPMPTATGSGLVKNGSAMELDIIVNNKQTPVTGLSTANAVKVDVTASGFAGVAKCVFFNLVTAAWSSEGVTTVVVGGVVQCRSTHLSLFAVQDEGQSSAFSSAGAFSAAAAVVVAAVVAVLG